MPKYGYREGSMATVVVVHPLIRKCGRDVPCLLAMKIDASPRDGRKLDKDPLDEPKKMHAIWQAAPPFLRRFLPQAFLDRQLAQIGFNGRLFITMFAMTLAGQSIEELLEEKKIRSPTQMKCIVLQVFQALSALHTAGWAHGDVTLSNIALRREDRSQLMLVDFGSAEKSPGEMFVDFMHSFALISAGQRLFGEGFTQFVNPRHPGAKLGLLEAAEMAGQSKLPSQELQLLFAAWLGPFADRKCRGRPLADT